MACPCDSALKRRECQQNVKKSSKAWVSLGACFSCVRMQRTARNGTVGRAWLGHGSGMGRAGSGWVGVWVGRGSGWVGLGRAGAGHGSGMGRAWVGLGRGWLLVANMVVFVELRRFRSPSLESCDLEEFSTLSESFGCCQRPVRFQAKKQSGKVLIVYRVSLKSQSFPKGRNAGAKPSCAAAML